MFRNRSHGTTRPGVSIAAALALLGVSVYAADVPTGIADPDVALADPIYSDPVFFWRMTSMPKDVYEPEPYFYWPAAVVTGSARALAAGCGRRGVHHVVCCQSLAAAAAQVEQRETKCAHHHPQRQGAA